MGWAGKCSSFLYHSFQFSSFAKACFFIFTSFVIIFDWFATRCWKVFKKWHVFSGYGLWIFCLIANQSPKAHYISTILMLAIEISIISSAPWFFWVIDAPFKAGSTFLSEYSLIIVLRLIVVTCFQWSLLSSIYYFISSIWKRIVLAVKTLAGPTSEFQANMQPSPTNVNVELQEKRGVGRPRKG